MRTGFSLKEAACVLGIHPKRVTQSLDPTLHRIALLWRADSTKTMQCILEAVHQLQPMTDDEIALRVQMLNGTLDREILHPRHTSR